MFGYTSRTVSFAKELASASRLYSTHRGMVLILPCLNYYVILYTPVLCSVIVSCVLCSVVVML